LTPWEIEMLCLYGDVADETGSLRPWWPGSLMEQPAREHMAMRVIRNAWAEHQHKELEKGKSGKANGR